MYIWSFDQQGQVYRDLININPYVYVKGEQGPDKRTTIYGDPVRRLEFSNLYEYNKAIRELSPNECKVVFENNFMPPALGILHDLPFNDDIEVVPRIMYFDIEVFSSKGFPTPDKAAWPVSSICCCRGYENDKVVVYGCKPLTDIEIGRLPDNATYYYCENEAELFLGFLSEMESCDVAAGWYSNQFDFPYLINRLKKVVLQLGKDGHELYEILQHGFDLVTVPGGTDIYTTFDEADGRTKYHIKIAGKALVDLLEVYKKYSYIKLPSYNLDHVGKFEFGEGKLKMYADGGSKELSLSNMYRHHWFNYIAYNIRDVILTRDIDRKRGLTALVLEICNISRIPADRTVYMSSIIDGALLKFLRRRNMVALGRHIPEKQKFKGGFVKKPIDVYGKGRLYRHTACFDVTSEYPSVVCKLNVSNETYIGKIDLEIFEDQYKAALAPDITDLLPKDPEAQVTISVYDGEDFLISVKDLVEHFDKFEWSVSCDGVLFDMTVPGVFSSFTEEGFAERKKFKRAYQKHRDLYEDNHDPNDKELRDKFYTKQMGMKLILNSGYGQTGSRFSRLYNPHIAQAITSTGQAVVFNGEKFVNEFFTKRYIDIADDLLSFVQKYNPSITQVPWWDVSVDDRVVTMDTDSVIFTVDDITGPVFDEEQNGLIFNSKDGGPTVAAINFVNTLLNKFVCPKLNEYLNTEFAPRRLRSNRDFALNFELEGEKTSAGSIFLRKKKYIHRIPKHMPDGSWTMAIQVKGYEMKKVNSPPDVSAALKRFVLHIFDDGFNWTHKFECFKEAIDRAVELTGQLLDGDKVEVANKLAFSSSINNMEKYQTTLEEGLFKKGTPAHVKGGILHNWLVRELDLNIPLIYSGDRASILKIKEDLPKANSIAFKERLPKEFEAYIEFDVYSVVKTHFLNKCAPLFDAFGWEKDWDDLLKRLYKYDNDWVETGDISIGDLKRLSTLTVRNIKPRSTNP